MAVDFKRDPPPLPTLTILNDAVPTTETFKNLGATISRDLECPEKGSAETVLSETAQKV